MDLKGLICGLFTTSISQVSIFFYSNLKINDLLNHVLVFEGIPLSYLFLISYWTSGYLPASYYDLDLTFKFVDFIGMLLLQDFLQYVSHVIAHKLRLKYHWPHHKATTPNVLDAFKGSVLDTSLMVLLPMFFTLQVFHTNCLTLQIFGSFYSSYLILIHADYEHPWEKYLEKIGFATSKDHRLHHQKRNVNFGHVFIIWDVLFNTDY